MSKFYNISTDVTLNGSAASNNTLSSQYAVKQYVDNEISKTVSWFDYATLTYENEKYICNKSVQDIRILVNSGKTMFLRVFVHQSVGCAFLTCYEITSSTVSFSGIYNNEMLVVVRGKVEEGDSWELQTYSINKTTAISDNKFLYNGQTIDVAVSGVGISLTNNLLNSNYNTAIKSGATNPFFGLKEGNNKWYVQALNNYFYLGSATSNALRFDQFGNGVFQTGSVTAQSFIKDGGSSSQFLKADGSVDSNNYLTHNDISGKQDTLVSGTNIKTVNGQTLLGSGNIDIEDNRITSSNPSAGQALVYNATSGKFENKTNIAHYTVVMETEPLVDTTVVINLTVPFTELAGHLKAGAELTIDIVDSASNPTKLIRFNDGYLQHSDNIHAIIMTSSIHVGIGAGMYICSIGHSDETGLAVLELGIMVYSEVVFSGEITSLSDFPSFYGNTGKVLAVQDDGNGEYLGWVNAGDFTHTPNTIVSASNATVTFAENTRGSVMLTTSADLALTIVCNNLSDNYIWIRNSGSAEADIVIGGVQHNGSAVSNVYVPSDGITVPAGGLCEIGVICNVDGAFITSRNDLTL